MFYVNKSIKNAVRKFPLQGRSNFYRFDMNENTEGLPKEFVNEVLKEVTPEFLATYPEQSSFLKKYASHIGLTPENVAVVNGSDAGIRYILETFCETGKNVVTVSPTFEMYAVNCDILGLKHKPVMYEPDLSINVDKIIAAIDDDTDIVALINPNNPVGNVYTEAEIEKVINRAKEVEAVVVIDEAYHYFCSETFVHKVLDYDNVIVLRTFSKLYSIAACRIGTIISNPQIISYIKNGRVSFEVNSIALLFAERLLERPDIKDALIAAEQDGKKFAIKELTEHGYDCRACEGNYLFVKPKIGAKEAERRLKEEKRILVHSYNNALLKEYIRVTTGSIRLMQIFLNALFEIEGEL